jgi:hypothetical protein
MTAIILKADGAKIYVNGVEIGGVTAVEIKHNYEKFITQETAAWTGTFEGIIVSEDRCQCGAISEYGCHGRRDGALYSEYLCKKCYHRRNK